MPAASARAAARFCATASTTANAIVVSVIGSRSSESNR